jgi:hypothetical protein
MPTASSTNPFGVRQDLFFDNSKKTLNFGNLFIGIDLTKVANRYINIIEYDNY